jgi:uncharacterized damage-inducible protein DinB
MIAYDTIIYQTLFIRGGVTKLLTDLTPAQSDATPPSWNNNARWHAGHLVLTPRLLTRALRGEPLGVDEAWRKWFAKGTSPAGWGQDPVPTLAELLPRITAGSEELFEEFRDRLDEPYATPYTTSSGAVLKPPGEALNFSLAHDGIHLGMLYALKRQIAAL